MMKEINICEVCGASNPEPVLNLGTHPLCDDLVPIGSHRICKQYPIEILFCDTCYTGHQRFQVPKHELFPKDYHYRARVTGSVLTGMSDLVNSCAKKFGELDGKKVLDIGCNDGSLLNFFGARGCKTFGIEPTGAALDSKHRTINAFFDEKSAKEVLAEFGKPDFITFTNVFAHITDLAELLRNLKLLVGESTIVVIENHYFGDILVRNQFDTFYHEHPRTYSLKSFTFVAKNLGVNILDFEFVSRYGGNIRVFLGHGEPCAKTVDESRFGQTLRGMNSEIDKWRVTTRDFILKHVADHGKLRAKAFPGRAAILIHLLGLNEEQISAVYEIKGSIKVGHYVPGTRIPILPEAILYEQDLNAPILNLAWHIPAEVRANLAANKYTGRVFDIK